jgi:hypothetical protein
MRRLPSSPYPPKANLEEWDGSQWICRNEADTADDAMVARTRRHLEPTVQSRYPWRGQLKGTGMQYSSCCHLQSHLLACCVSAHFSAASSMGSHRESPASLLWIVYSRACMYVLLSCSAPCCGMCVYSKLSPRALGSCCLGQLGSCAWVSSGRVDRSQRRSRSHGPVTELPTI